MATTVPEATYTQRLAEFAHGIRFDDLPDDVQHEVLRIFLDCIGSAVAGLVTPAGQIAIDLAKDEHGPLEAHVIGAGRSSLLPATYANAVLTNAIDYEVYGPEGHVCAIAAPAALSAGGAVSASGNEVLTALVAGLEVGGRIGGAIRRPGQAGARGIPPVRGHVQVVFAAAAAAGRLLQLTAGQMHHALGIAGYSATVPTLRKFFASPYAPMTKYDHIALMAQTGVQAALLAQRGYTGDLEVLEGDIGLWRFGGAMGCDWDFLTKDLGTYWTIREVNYKPYPVTLYNNPYIDLARRIVREHNLKPESIEQVDILLSRNDEARSTDRPSTAIEAWLNARYNVAAGIYDVSPRRSWQEPQTYQRQDILAFMDRIELGRIPEEELTSKGNYWEGWCPVRVRIQSADQTYEDSTDYLPKLSDQQLSTKFQDNVGGLLSDENARRAEQLCWTLPELPAIGQLTDLLVVER